MLTLFSSIDIINVVIEMEIMYEEIGRRIAKRRRALKMKQEELASILNVSNNHISSIERGRSAMSIELFSGICTALKITPDYLLLGAMHSNNVPQNVVDTLRLCSDKQIAFVLKFAQLLLDEQFEIIDGDNLK